MLLAPFAVQRAPVTGREPLDVRVPEGRADELRVSEPGRRALRLLDERLLEEDCAGLRSLECAAGRLKCGLAVEDLLAAAGLCAAGILGVCTSGALIGGAGAGTRTGAAAWTVGST